MAKYDGWTLGETEALLNVVGGVDVARAVLRGERTLTINQIARPEQPKPPLAGKVVKTIIVPAYTAEDFAEAVRLGKFDNDTGNIVRQFAKEWVGLDKSVRIDLVEFNRDWWRNEAIAWGVANGKEPIAVAHLMGIAAGLPNEQRERFIVELGSVRDGLVLYLRGSSGWRGLGRGAVRGAWARDSLVGFVSE
ncbi:hypothetical protein HYW17_03375 [Candidatus Uhrbacteria bacterium]|nr:hypothetical protein [Candidatus Uhrbacteria bacterium]